MHSPICHQATRIVPKPTEFKVKPVRMKRTRFSRSQPPIVIYTCRNRCIGLLVNTRFPVHIKPGLPISNLPQLSRPNKITRLPKLLLASLPVSYLHDAGTVLPGFHHHVTFPYRMAHRFFKLYMFSRF